MKLPLSRGRLFTVLALYVFAAAAFAALPPEEIVAPPAPTVAPLIGNNYPNDADQDRVADSLAQRVVALDVQSLITFVPDERDAAQQELDQFVEVELIFDRQITQAQLDTFTGLGGEISYIYKAVSFGWNGRVPLGIATALPSMMGASLVLVQEPAQAELHMDTATRTGRVRPIWASGFVGNVAGYDGDTNITIAIVDTGVDESHTDLNGRRIYWKDFSSDAAASPTDLVQHGSHVTGIATGTGASAGNGTSTLFYTHTGDLTGIGANSFFPSPIELPANSVTVTLTAAWNGGGNTSLYWANRAKGGGGYGGLAVASGTSPQTLTYTFTPNTSEVYTPALLKSGAMTTFYVKCQVTAYAGPGDGFNKMRGVAPGCKWAGAKVFTSAGSGNNSFVNAAIDHLVANRVGTNIKVMNLSLGTIGTPGIDTSQRQKINTAVNNGIVVVVSAGNDGGAQQVDDPGRAAMALTVAAANDVNQLTSYTSEGFSSPGSTSGQEEDYKPDLMAPGGSSTYYSSVLSVDSNTGDGTAFTDQQANDYYNIQGTSMASPFAAGCAALVIDALQQTGVTWDFNSSQHSRYVKMVLCATASESNTNREDGAADPSLQRAAVGPNGFPAGKDQYEGYGMINPDAAVAAVATRFTIGFTNVSFGSTVTDQRVWASTVNITNGRMFIANLTNPATGDFDLHLYSATPSAYGNPVLLASSTGAGNGGNESLTYTPPAGTNAILVVKRISGSGTFSLRTKVNFTPKPANPTLGTTMNKSNSIVFAKLASDADGDTLGFSVSGSSTQGGTVTVGANGISYIPPAGFSGSDSFTYTVNDGQGGTTNGTVMITVAANVVSLNVVSGPTIVGGNFVVRFAGIPGRTYTVEWSANVTGPWSKATNLAAPGSDTGYGIGVFEFSEATGGNTTRYYRTIYPSY